MAGCPSLKKPTPRKHYIDRHKLADLVREHRSTGVVPEALARALIQIAGGVWDRYRWTDDRDDFAQDAALHMLGRPLEKADVDGHLFNYFTTCSIRWGLKLRDKANGERRRFAAYAEQLKDSGRELPTRDEEGEVEGVDEDGGEWVVYDTCVAEFTERFVPVWLPGT